MNVGLKPRTASSNREVLAGLIERVAFHKATTNSSPSWGMPRPSPPGEWITAAGKWVNDRIHRQQFKTRFLRGSAPITTDGVERNEAEPFERSEPQSRAIATSMTQVLMDRFQTFSVLSPRRTRGRLRGYLSMAQEISLVISVGSFGLVLGFLGGYSVRAYISHQRGRRRTLRGSMNITPVLSPQRAFRHVSECAALSTSLLKLADYADVLRRQSATDPSERSSKVRTLAESTHHAVYGELYPSAKDTVYFEPPAAIACAG